MKKLTLSSLVVLGLILPSFSSLMAEDGFSNQSEASVVVTGGNTDLQVYNFKTMNKYIQQKNTYTLSGHYTYGTSEEELNARNGKGMLRYDRAFNDWLGGIAAYEYEQDKFRGFLYRQNFDLGLSASLVKTDRQSLKVEVGYRFTREKAVVVPNPVNFQKSRYAAIYEYKAQKNWSFTSTQELLLNHSESEDTIFTIEPALNMVLTDRISFKFGYKGIYENLPKTPGIRKFDYQITSGLIANF